MKKTIFPITVRPIGESIIVVACSTCAAHMTGCTGHFISLNNQIPSYGEIFFTHARTMIVPGLVEECFWRKLALGNAHLWSPRSLIVNVLFTASHLLSGQILAPYRPGAASIFSSPTFLGLTWILGMACTHAYINSGRTLFAPVLVHSCVVTCWLTCLGGEQALSLLPYR
mmetsp:Transcript_11910/g.17843  ORF Transcript_11910/g.17843 Transcript_11910/m.17843 type:complete len:170 (+) Transcript_11910:11-520(+)